MTNTRTLLIAACLLSLGQRIAVAQWNSIGPTTTGIQIRALALAADGTLYAGSNVGVLRRIASTQNWEARNTGLSNLNVLCLAADPIASGTLYAGTVSTGTQTGGVFKTTDSGSGWSPVNTGLVGTGVASLAVDVAQPSTLYAAVSGISKSANGGATWSTASTGLTGADSGAFALVIDSRNDNILYTSTRDGAFKSTDGAASWQPINNGLGSPPWSAQAFAIDPTNSLTIYLASFAPISAQIGNGVYKSTDGGTSWSPANNGIRTAIQTVAIDQRSPATVYAAVQGGGVFRTSDAGAQWPSLNGGLTDLNVLALIVDPTGTVYAGTRDGGVFRLSTDGNGVCASGPTTLCLNANRFRAEVSWRTSDGVTGVGHALTMTSDTGSFWFFTSNNIELVVKVVDGRPFNNKFWVFYGALSNVEYTVTVTDSQSGAVKTYFNPQGQLASVADTAAF